MIKPIISVVLPVFNAENYLEEAIESILNQTFDDFEFIILNDGSSDNSLRIIERYALQDDRIIIVDRHNKGLTATLNEGFSLARGKYIARMDADDICLPNRFLLQYELIQKNSLDICGCHYSMINKHGKFIDTIYTPLDNKSLLVFLILAVPFAHGSVMLSSDFITKHNLKYGQNGVVFAEDKALWKDMFFLNAKFGNVNNVLFKYREFNQSLSKTRASDLRNDDTNIRLELLKFYSGEIKEALIFMCSSIDSLSIREIEYVSELTLMMFWSKRDFFYLQLYRKLPIRFKIISFFKLFQNL